MAHLGDRVAAFVDGQLSADEHEAAVGHLERCRDCRGAVEQQMLLKHRMTGLHAAPAPPASLLSTLADPANLPRRPQRSILARIWHLRGLRGLVALTGASLTVTIVAYAVGSPPREDDETATPPIDRFVSRFASASPVAMRPERARQTATGAVYRLGSTQRSVPEGADSPAAIELLRRAAGAGRTVSLALLTKNFDLSVASTALIDGRDAIEVVAGHHGQIVASYWVARDDGRLIRTIAYDQTGTPVSQTDASDSTTGSAAGGSVVGTQIAPSSLPRLQKSGWPCHDKLSAELERVDSSWVEDGGERVIALTYTDGVSTMSLFEQSGVLESRSLDGFKASTIGGATVWIRPGAPSVATWDDGTVVFTIVTDADRSQLRRAIADLPHAPAEQGGLDRVGTGIRRISAWVSPAR